MTENAVKPMLNVIVDESEKSKFEAFSNLNSLIIFMAGCAIRERMELIENYQNQVKMGSEAAKTLMAHEEKIVSDFCRIVALAESTDHTELQSKIDFLKEWAKDA